MVLRILLKTKELEGIRRELQPETVSMETINVGISKETSLSPFFFFIIEQLILRICLIIALFIKFQIKLHITIILIILQINNIFNIIFYKN